MVRYCMGWYGAILLAVMGCAVAQPPTGETPLDDPPASDPCAETEATEESLEIQPVSLCFGATTDLVIRRSSPSGTLNLPLTLTLTFAEFTLAEDDLNPNIAQLAGTVLNLDKTTLATIEVPDDTLFLRNAITCPAADPGDDEFFIHYDAVIADACGVILSTQRFSTTCCGPEGEFGCDQVCNP